MDDIHALMLELVAEADEAHEDYRVVHDVPAEPPTPEGGEAPAATPSANAGPAADVVGEPEITEETAAMGETPYGPAVYMGIRHVARSADGLEVMNSLEVLPHFEPSV